MAGRGSRVAGSGWWVAGGGWWVAGRGFNVICYVQYIQAPGALAFLPLFLNLPRSVARASSGGTIVPPSIPVYRHREDDDDVVMFFFFVFESIIRYYIQNIVN